MTNRPSPSWSPERAGSASRPDVWSKNSVHGPSPSAVSAHATDNRTHQLSPHAGDGRNHGGRCRDLGAGQDCTRGALSQRLPVLATRQVHRHRARAQVLSHTRRNSSLLCERAGARRISDGHVPERLGHRRRSRVRARTARARRKGILLEGDRRALDVMVKNDQRYKDTGGWGFEHFERDSTAATLTADRRGKCFECHSTAARDHVFSTIRK